MKAKETQRAGGKAPADSDPDLGPVLQESGEQAEEGGKSFLLLAFRREREEDKQGCSKRQSGSAAGERGDSPSRQTAWEQ